jgi:hypothetical protein
VKSRYAGKNPFKFGSIVEEPYFMNRVEETRKVKSIVSSANHLIIISPRRYGKTSLINNVAKSLKRPYIILDLQLITTQSDFASQLLKRIYRVYPAQKLKDLFKNFRIAPSITLNPMSNEIDISYKAATSETAQTALEDVLNLLDKLSTKKTKLIIILDEFQDIKRIGNNLDRFLRSIIQHHKNINYVFLGSQESLIREIFEEKKSPFYHFGYLLPLDKIPCNEFLLYLTDNFKELTEGNNSVSKKILDITKCHPYYTQQLAFTVWELLFKNNKIKNPVETAVAELMRHHDVDYERLWNTINRSDMKILIGMSISESSPLSEEFSKQYDTGASSTVFSSLKRLTQNGFIVKSSSGYKIDDPFFKEWIRVRRLK